MYLLVLMQDRAPLERGARPGQLAPPSACWALGPPCRRRSPREARELRGHWLLPPTQRCAGSFCRGPFHSLTFQSVCLSGRQRRHGCPCGSHTKHPHTGRGPSPGVRTGKGTGASVMPLARGGGAACLLSRPHAGQHHLLHSSDFSMLTHQNPPESPDPCLPCNVGRSDHTQP